MMYLLYPLAYPTALLLDRVLGKEEGTTYKKAGLKTLVSLHRTLGTERLNDDEVTIITAVLDLKEKPVGDIMTPLKDVYVMAADQTMDVKTMNEILSKGYSRIPIHSPGKMQDFIGMLLVKTLITYDPEDEWPVSAFTLATLPETKPTTSALDILNYFQEYPLHLFLFCYSTNLD
jgi:metal transporter CNNM